MTDADLNTLRRCVAITVKRLTDEPAPSRADVERGIVLPILQALEWDVFDTKAVQSGFPGSGATFDIALCDGQARPQLLLEIHGAQFDPGIVSGTLARARRAGVPLVVLTNGPAWRLFLAEAAADSAVPVFELELGKADAGEFAATLQRYLRRDMVLRGESLKDALAANALPAAWRALVTRKDSLLLELLADEVRDRVGIKPGDAAVVAFLHGLSATGPARAVAARRTSKRKGTKRATVKLLGQRSEFTYGKDAMVWLLTELQRREPGFLEGCSRHATFRTEGAPRLATSPTGLASHRHASLPDGWYYATKSSSRRKEREARAAAEVAGLKFGIDVTVDFRSP